MSTGRYGHPGHNSHDADAEFGRAIDTFVGEERIEEALLRETLVQMDSGERLVLLRNATLLGLAKLCRVNPRMACDPAVFMLIVAFCDNDHGYCWLSQRRMGEILARTRTTIVEAIGRLHDNGLIQMMSGDGENNAYWPTIPPLLQEAPAGVSWFIDHFSTPSQQVREKRAGSRPTLSERLNNLSAPAKSEPVGSTEQVLEPTCRLQPNNLSAPRDTILPKETLPKEVVVEDLHRARAREDILHPSGVETVEPWHPADEQQARYHAIYAAWGQSGILLSPVTVEIARRSMLRVVEPHGDTDPTTLGKAIGMALACCEATEHDRRGDTKGAPKIGAFPNYFAKVLAAKIEDVGLSALRLATNAAVITETGKITVQTEKQVATRKLEALNASIEATAARRALAAPGTKSAATGQNSGFQREDRFGPMEKFSAVRFTSITSREANFVLDDVPGATKADVERAFIAVSGELGSSKSKEAPPLDTILATWRMHTWRLVAKRKFPTPAELCGGAVASYHPADEPGDTERLMQRKWFALSQPFVDGLVKEFPTIDASEVAEAFRDLDETDFNATAMDKPIREYERHGNLEATFQPACYGTTLQAAVEAYVRKRMAKLHACTVAQQAKMDEAKRLDPSLERRVLSEAECKALAANQTPGEAEFEPSQAV